MPPLVPAPAAPPRQGSRAAPLPYVFSSISQTLGARRLRVHPHVREVQPPGGRGGHFFLISLIAHVIIVNAVVYRTCGAKVGEVLNIHKEALASHILTINTLQCPILSWVSGGECTMHVLGWDYGGHP